MVETARQVIAITDSSKFGKVCLHRIIDISEIDALITDADAPDFIREAADRLGFKLHMA
jgi:DeoR family transcriptional regulator of aga operon